MLDLKYVTNVKRLLYDAAYRRRVEKLDVAQTESSGERRRVC
jgi:hypothetical protein